MHLLWHVFALLLVCNSAGDIRSRQEDVREKTAHIEAELTDLSFSISTLRFIYHDYNNWFELNNLLNYETQARDLCSNKLYQQPGTLRRFKHACDMVIDRIVEERSYFMAYFDEVEDTTGFGAVSGETVTEFFEAAVDVGDRMLELFDEVLRWWAEDVVIRFVTWLSSEDFSLMVNDVEHMVSVGWNNSRKLAEKQWTG